MPSYLEIWNIATYLLYAALVPILVNIGRKGIGKEKFSLGVQEMEYVEPRSKKDLIKRLLKGATIILALAAFVSLVALGTSSDCSNGDPLYGGCSTTQDGAPTDHERILTFLYWSVLIGVPCFVGWRKAYRKVATNKK